MPTLPQIIQAYDDVAPRAGAIFFGDYTNDASPLIRVELGDQLAAGDDVFLSEDGVRVGSPVSVTAEDLARGYVEIQLSGLSEGWRALTAVIAAPDGSVKASSNLWALGVETDRPDAPTILAADDDAGSATGDLADGASTDDTTPTFRIFEPGLPDAPSGSPGHAPYGGSALMGGLVELYEGGVLAATGRLGYGGEVNLTPGALSAGAYEFTARVVDRAGNVSDFSAPFRVTVAPGEDAGQQLQATGLSRVYGGLGDDTLQGSQDENYLRGDEGDDLLRGGAAFDDLHGNMGDDTVHGGAGDDWVVGGKDDDLQFGDDGSDIVWGNLGADTLDGGDGIDQVRGGKQDDVVNGGAGDDFVSGDKGSDTLAGGAGADAFHTFFDAGLDLVLDFDAAEGDRVQLLPGADVAVTQVGADVQIDTGPDGRMILVGVDLATLPGGWIFGG